MDSLQQQGRTRSVVVESEDIQTAVNGMDRYVNFYEGASDGLDSFIKHELFDLKHDGTALFSGQVDIITKGIVQGLLDFHMVFRDPLVVHGMTAIVDTDVFAAFGVGNSLTGELLILGFTENDNAALSLQGTTTGSNVNVGAVNIGGWKKSGTGRTAMTSTDVILGLRAGASTVLRFTAAGGIIGSGDISAASVTIPDNVTRVGGTTTDAGTGANTSEVTLHTVTVPAGVMGTNGGIRIVIRGKAVGNASTKIVKIKVAGTQIAIVTFTSGEDGVYDAVIHGFNRGATNDQKWSGLFFENEDPNALTTSDTAIDTTASFDVTLTARTLSAADEITAELAVVELIRD